MTAPLAVSPTTPPLTWLYAPGDRPRVVAKALAAGADVVVVDLEDAVAADRKEYARDATAELLGEPQPVRAGVYCGYRPLTRTLTCAHARGPAPLLFRGGTGRELPGQDGPSGQAEAPLEAGDLLLLHTEALEPDAVERLLSLAPRLTGADSARDAVRMVTRELGESPGRRDVCVLVARVTP